MNSKIKSVLNIKYPVIQGGMAWVSDAKLAAAVSEAGGAGIISSGGRDLSYIKEQISLARALTKRPFGVNVQLMAANKEEVIDLLCAEKVDFVTLGAGNPTPFFEKLSRAGVKKIPVVPNVKLAKRVEAAGADAIIVEGMEAGGHIGSVTTMALMTQVIPEVKLPVIVAGGFADGRGLAAALVMGAAGVQFGTRFLLAEECSVPAAFKQKLIEATDTDSIVTGQIIGHAVRGLKNKFSLHFVELEKKGVAEDVLLQMATGTNKLAAVDGDVENGMMQAGQSLLPLRRVEPARAIVENMVMEACELLVKAPQLTK